ncbi:MAG: FAD-binding oxidoreductase, partial [Gammaproteobacteria bacterium]
MADLLERLRAVVGEDGLLTGVDVSSRAAGIWNPDGIRARAIVSPRDTAQVSRVLALCHEARQ